MINKNIQAIAILLFAVFFSACHHTDKQYYDDGTLKSEIVTKSGKKDGIAKYYHANGKLQQEMNFKNDVPEGISRRWYFNGRQELEENYKNGLKTGRAVAYNKYGKKIWEAHFLNDTLNGPWQEFHGNGNPKVIGYYKKGLFEKTWRYFDEDNQMIGEGKFDQGTGFQHAYYPNGKKWRLIFYRQNKKDGTERWWYPDGKLQKEKIYKNDSLLSVRDYQNTAQ